LLEGGGTFTGPYDLVITGTASLSGTHSGAGTTVLQGASWTNIFSLDANRVLRIENTLISAGQIELNSTSAPGTGTIQTVSGATFVASGDDAYGITVYNNAPALFENQGTFRKSGSEADHTTIIEATFNNSGSVEVQTGILQLDNGGTHTGNFTVAAAAELQFSGGTHTISSGTMNAPGSVTVSGIAAVDWNTSFNIAGTLRLEFYPADQGSILSVNSNSQTNSFIQEIETTLSGTGIFTVTGTATIDGGLHTGLGTTVLQGNSTISEGTTLSLDGGRLLRNENTLTCLSINIDLNGTPAPGSGIIRNLSGATFAGSEINLYASDHGVADNGSDAFFDNQGTFRSGGGSDVSIAFNNSGIVDVQTGLLYLGNGGTHTGSFIVADGAELTLGGTHHLNSSQRIEGSLNIEGHVILGGGAAAPEMHATSRLLVPEPGAGALVVFGLALLGLRRRVGHCRDRRS
jgi:fibronectin-binding autotransporter adhesin